MKRIGAVHFGGFIVLVRDTLEAGEKVDHEQGGPSPDDKCHDRRLDGNGVREPVDNSDSEVAEYEVYDSILSAEDIGKDH